MASLKILDTGYSDKTRIGTIEATRANSGVAIDLTNTASIKLRRGANIDAVPEPGIISQSGVNANLISTNNDRYDLELVLNKTNSTQQEILKDLIGVKGNSSYPGIMHTKGVKALYVSGVADTKKTIVELLGSTATAFHTAGDISAGLPAFIVHINSLVVTDSPGSTSITVRIGLVEA